MMITLFATQLIGCASIQVSEITDENRDMQATFDGQWTAIINTQPTIQQIGSRGFDCHGRSLTIEFDVEEGVVGPIRGLGVNDSQTNISETGKFRLEIPTEQSYDTVRPSQDAGITLVLQGRLINGARSGLFVIGMNDLNKNGCSHVVSFYKGVLRSS